LGKSARFGAVLRRARAWAGVTFDLEIEHSGESFFEALTPVER
jgi:hypothetical protein